MSSIKFSGTTLLLSVLALLLFSGCSKQNSKSVLDPDTGTHVANWYVDHRAAYKNSTSDCSECHGTDLKGGTSAVSCYSADYNGMTCHANGPTSHPTNWASADIHGASAKSAPSSTTGFSACQTCHGSDFSGGLSLKSCLNTAGCHGATVNAPHSPAPWRGAGRTHITTDTGNAATCALCHTNGANSTVKPSTPAPAGTAAGCFNNTLCHSTVGHAVGWSSPDVHGASAKSAPSSTAGFSSCQICHGSDFSGGIALTSCLNTAGCHGATVNAPHSPAPWRSATRTHTTTNTGNAVTCALCHTNGANSSVQPSTPAPAGTAAGCFNNTLCHAAIGHPVGWSAANQHGTAAELDFSVCKTCHGQDYKGGIATTTCYSCHNGPGLDHPAAAWVVPDHKTAALTDNVVCQKCHGTDYLGGGSHRACNSCHMENQTKVHMLAWYPDVQTNHRAYALANGTTKCANIYCHGAALTGVSLSGPSCSTCHTWPFTGGVCGTCHGIPPTGTSFPNTAGSHTAHTVLSTTIVCSTCHLGAGSGTSLHQNGTADVILDTTYSAKTGTPGFNTAANTCSRVSCHGGQTTPSWLTGVINVNTQCTVCHASGTTQYNSYNSGEHSLHVSRFACTVCHDTTKLAVNHFTKLNTSVMEGPASATIVTAIGYNGTSCNPSAGGLTGCHSSHTW